MTPPRTDGPTRRRVLRGFVGTAATVGTVGCLDALIPEATPDVPFLGDGPTVRFDTIATGLTYPTDLKEPDDGSGRLFVTDQPGQLYYLDDGDLVGPLLDVSDRMPEIGLESMGGFDERGLLGIEFHPDFATNGRCFLRYSAIPAAQDPPDAAHTEVLVEYIIEGEEVSLDDERVVLRIPQPSWIHNSGNILFGPDGYLYIPTGDGGGKLDEHAPSWFDQDGPGTGQQTRDNLLGGVLRIDVEGDDGATYAIPGDNPLLEAPDSRDEYFAWGFRNPWGATFDGEDLLVADVGQAMFEIVNRVERGGNYGWNVREGTHCYDHQAARDPPDECPAETPDDVRGGEALLDPFIEYPQRPDDGDQIGSAIIGGHVYRGDAIPELDGTYVFGDWSADPHGDPRGQAFAAAPAGDDDVHPYYTERDLWPIEALTVEGDGDVAIDGRLNRYVVSVGMDLAGELYFLTSGSSAIEGDTGEVHRIVAPEG